MQCLGCSRLNLNSSPSSPIISNTLLGCPVFWTSQSRAQSNNEPDKNLVFWIVLLTVFKKGAESRQRIFSSAELKCRMLGSGAAIQLTCVQCFLSVKLDTLFLLQELDICICIYIWCVCLLVCVYACVKEPK